MLKINQQRDQTNRVQSNDHESESDYSLAVVKTVLESSKLPRVSFKPNDTNWSFMVESGASINLADNKTHQLLGFKCPLKPADITLFAYGGKKPLPLLGKFQAKVESSEGKSVFADFYVAKYASHCLLSFNAASQLNKLQLLNAVSAAESSGQKGWYDFSGVFKGVGKLKDFQLGLNINESVEPVWQKQRRVPFKTRPKVEVALKKLYDCDTCEDADNIPTPWVSPIVVVQDQMIQKI